MMKINLIISLFNENIMIFKIYIDYYLYNIFLLQY